MRSANQWADDADRRPVWTLLKAAVIGTVIVLVCVALVGLATTGSVFFAGTAAKVTNPSRVQQKVYDPNNTIAQIAFFHNTCNTAAAQFRIVQNNQKRLKADEHAAQFATSPIQQQQAVDSLASDQTDVTGAQNALETTVADYNSRSAQSTANVFKDNDLPERLSADGPINCG